jgi:NTE family protein
MGALQAAVPTGRHGSRLTPTLLLAPRDSAISMTTGTTQTDRPLGDSTGRPRTGLVLSGGGARGAYEAGVLSYLYDEVVPKLGPDFEFDIVAGTSVGAIHAGFVAATSHLEPKLRAQELREIWGTMSLDQVLRVSARDLVEVPLRALGVETLIRSARDEDGKDLLGGLVDITPLEQLVDRRVPWKHLRENLERGRPGVLSISCTEIESGRVAVFLDGPDVDAGAWNYDPHTVAIPVPIDSRHVRASAAIPFLFPAVRIDDRWYIDGGLRLNTPLSPALRLGASKLLVVALKTPAEAVDADVVSAETAVSQPAFLLGKVLNILMLDQLEHELRRLELINTLVDGASEVLGAPCLDRINEVTRAKRGLEYRNVDTVVVRPSADLGAVAAHAYEHRREESRSRGVVASLLARTALLGVPEKEADLLSYIYFDASFTGQLIELGREDARAQHDELLELLTIER